LRREKEQNLYTESGGKRKEREKAPFFIGEGKRGLRIEGRKESFPGRERKGKGFSSCAKKGEKSKDPFRKWRETSSTPSREKGERKAVPNNSHPAEKNRKEEGGK